jgi:ElaB/YqjD/DUF883 family membrane-anchored ribosome-binding protein
MKNKKSKQLAKSAKKAIREELTTNLIADLEQTITKLGHTSKDATKEIKKAAGKLAKRLAQKIKVDKPAEAKKAEADKESVEASPKITKTAAKK